MVNAAIVGLGWWGKTITRMLAGSTALRLVAAHEHDRAAGEAFCAAHGMRHADSFAALLASPAVDAVILTTPHRFHVEQIEQAAAAGKHVFCEKPLALTAEAAERGIRACMRAGVRLGIGHERRYEPPMQFVQQLLRTGELGTLMQIEGNFSQNKFLALDPSNWRLSKAEAGCGPMTATGIHFLDAAVSLAGPALQVRATNFNGVSGFGSGDSASAHIRFGNGVTATINALLATPFYSRFTVFGSKGWVEVRDKSHVEAPSGWTVVRSAPGDTTTTVEYPVADPSPVRANLEAFAAAIAGTQADYPVPLQDMRDTVALLESVYRAAEDGTLRDVPHTALPH